MLTKEEFANLIKYNREAAFHAYFEASVERWLEHGPREIVRILTLWATKGGTEGPRIVVSDAVLLEAGEGRAYPYQDEKDN